MMRYSAEYKEPVARLQRHLWSPSTALNTAYLEWKYERNPFIPEPLIHLVLHGDEVVGMRGVVGTQWSVGGPKGTSFVLPYADDLVIAPEHRNRGLFALIMEAMQADLREAGYEMLISLSAGGPTRLLSLATGWKQVGSLDRISFANDASTVSSASDSSLQFARRVAGRLRRAVRPDSAEGWRVPTDREFSDVAEQMMRGADPHVELTREPDLDGMVTLNLSTERWVALCHVRNREYLEWRLDCPKRRYWFLNWYDGSLRGYVVLGWRWRSPLSIQIVDHAAESSDVFRRLVTVVCELPSVQLEMMATGMDAPVRRAAIDLGFSLPQGDDDNGVPRYLLIFPTDPRSTLELPHANLDPGKIESWRVGLIDSMDG